MKIDCPFKTYPHATVATITTVAVATAIIVGKFMVK